MDSNTFVFLQIEHMQKKKLEGLSREYNVLGSLSCHHQETRDCDMLLVSQSKSVFDTVQLM